MNFKSFLLIIVSVFSFQLVLSQANILNAVIPEEIGEKTLEQLISDDDMPLEYGYVDDRDIMWSKMTWEKIDLNERINFPLYFPVDTLNSGSYRRSLYDILVRGIKEGEIPNVYSDSYFSSKRTLDDIQAAMSKVDTMDVGYDQYNAEGRVDPEYIVKRNISSYDISAYLIRGLWYFDKRQGELRYRLLAIAPAAPDVNFIDSDDEANKMPIPLFWVFYPDARYILHNAMAYNGENSASAHSFDHVLNSRRFNAIIYKEENVYGDRAIKDYIPDNALMQLLESQRIKENIRNFESDMWQY